MVSRVTICVILQLLFSLFFMAGLSTAEDESCTNCLGLTCAGASPLLGCQKTCICTAKCNLFCPNGDCLAYCSCFKAEEIGIGDLAAAKFDNSVYVVNRTQIPDDFSDKDLLHNTLLGVNQTWWQVCDDGTYYDERKPHNCGNGKAPGCFSCELKCKSYGALFGCYGSCGCSQYSEGCAIHCSATQCKDMCTCNRF